MSFAATSLRPQILTAAGTFLKCSVADAYQRLGLSTFLLAPKTPKEVATSLGWQAGAASRFLHAAASIGLARKEESSKFVSVYPLPEFNRALSPALFWFTRNKVPDHIQDTPLTPEQLQANFGAEATGHCEALIKAGLMDFLDGKYKNGEAVAAYLLSGSEEYLAPILHHYEIIVAPMFQVPVIENALKTGRSQWRLVFGRDVNHPFELYREEPDLLEAFVGGLHLLNKPDDEMIAETLSLGNVGTVLDIGGASGAFAQALLNDGPTIQKIDIYELPDAIPVLNKVMRRYILDNSRITFLPGSFLKESETPSLQGLSPDKRYDLVILAWILHDWNDATALSILKRARNHLAQGGRLILLEVILSEDRIGPETMLDLAMLLQTEGKERTFEEYRNLLQRAGFTKIILRETGTSRRLIEAMG